MQQLNPSEISEIIKSRIAKLDTSTEARNEGTVVSVSDGIVRIHGLADVMFGEMIEFEGGIYGMALNLEQDSVGAVVLGDYRAWPKVRKSVVPVAFWKSPLAPKCWVVWLTLWVTRSMAKARSMPSRPMRLKR